MGYMEHTWVDIATTFSVTETKLVAQALAAVVSPGDVITLDGDLGAGKTQFVQGFADELDVDVAVTSPTFNLLSVYQGADLLLYHFDLYRLEVPDELDDIDFYSLVEDDGVSCIEWASKFPDEMPEDRIEIYLEVLDESSRRIRARAWGSAQCLLGMWQSALV